MFINTTNEILISVYVEHKKTVISGLATQRIDDIHLKMKIKYQLSKPSLQITIIIFLTY